MIDSNMNKTQLRKKAGLNTSVSLDSLMCICHTLHCDVGDIVEVVETTESNINI